MTIKYLELLVQFISYTVKSFTWGFLGTVLASHFTLDYLDNLLA